MNPRIVIVGRPNVGKSTLFNRLLRSRIAITDGQPGVTRDFVTGTLQFADKTVQLVDTGGIGDAADALIDRVRDRSIAEIPRADVVVAVVDVTNITGDDQEMIEIVRRADLPTIVVANKVDSARREALVPQVWELGVEDVVAVSAEHGHGISDLEERLADLIRELPRVHSGATARSDSAEAEGTIADPGLPEQEQQNGPVSPAIRLAIVGKPNTGKSSLLNRLVQADRALVSDIPGTTRDRVEAEFQYGDERFEVVDTAGIRRRSRIHDPVEYYSVSRALQAVRQAEVVILLVDATTGLSDQDKKIAAHISESGRGAVVVLNKWDLTSQLPNQLQAMSDRIAYLFPVFRHAPVLPVSAQTGYGVDEMIQALLMVHRELNKRVETARLNQALQTWVEQTPPPTEKGKRWKVRYITQVQANPVRFILFVNRVRGFPDAYAGYIRNCIRRDFGFHHIPFFLEIRAG